MSTKTPTEQEHLPAEKEAYKKTPKSYEDLPLGSPTRREPNETEPDETTPDS